MAQETLERIVEDVKTLTPQEQQRLRVLLDQSLSGQAEEIEAKERLLMQRLLEKGIIDNIPSGLPDASDDDYVPISVQGRPVSETLLEDREPF